MPSAFKSIDFDTSSAESSSSSQNSSAGYNDSIYASQSEYPKREVAASKSDEL